MWHKTIKKNKTQKLHFFHQILAQSNIIIYKSLKWEKTTIFLSSSSTAACSFERLWGYGLYLKYSSLFTTWDIGNHCASSVSLSRSSYVFKCPPVCFTIKLKRNHPPGPNWMWKRCSGSPSTKLSSWSSRLHASYKIAFICS